MLHVRNLHWIVVEDSVNKTDIVTNFLKVSGMNHTHLDVHIKFQSIPKTAGFKPHWIKHKGVVQRNKALEWIRLHLNASKDEGVIYFADDDNTYDLQVFEKVSNNKIVS